jgi:Flp pilus assembly protein TadG
MAQQMTALTFHSLLSHKGTPLGPKQIVRREDAQSLVELALLMPLFILLLLGSAELARFGWAAILVANAARAGAAYGSQNVNAATDLASIQTVALKDGINLPNLVTTRTQTCACSNGNTIASCTTTALSDCPAPATIFNYVQVNTSTQLPWGIVRGQGAAFTVTGHSTMVIEQ